MERPNPCFVCGKIETSIAYAQDPWCGVDCHKKLAFVLAIPEWDLVAEEFESAMRRIAKQLENKIILLRTPMIEREIKRGRNYTEVYGSKNLLLEAERPGNWRDSNLRVELEGWIVPKV